MFTKMKAKNSRADRVRVMRGSIAQGPLIFERYNMGCCLADPNTHSHADTEGLGIVLHARNHGHGVKFVNAVTKNLQIRYGGQAGTYFLHK